MGAMELTTHSQASWYRRDSGTSLSAAAHHAFNRRIAQQMQVASPFSPGGSGDDF